MATLMRCLIYGTTYIDSPHRKRMLELWLTLHTKLNPECDLVLVDSLSPISVEKIVENLPAGNARVNVFQFGDNVGHLSRNFQNGKKRDGWGRAFCRGIELAKVRGYDWVAHIEGDSLFRLPVKPIFEGMWRDKYHVISIPVNGTKRQEVGWVETGLMFMSVWHMHQIKFIEKYNWEHRTPTPTPEKVIHGILGKDLTMAKKIVGLRGDKNQITVDNCATMDWITHCWDRTEVYEAFVNAALRQGITQNYDEHFFAMHTDWEGDYRTVADIIIEYLGFDRAVDFGCGNGFIVKRLREQGKQTVAIDGSECARKWVPNLIVRDLTEPVDAGQYDLAICSEVAEHLPPDASDTLVDSLVRGKPENVFFTAAKHGRGGHLHLNEQEASYWIAKFEARGYELNKPLTLEIRWQIANRTAAIWWFATNAMVFRRA